MCRMKTSTTPVCVVCVLKVLNHPHVPVRGIETLCLTLQLEV